MTNILILVSVVIILCIILNKVSSKAGMPMLLAFIVLGMIFGSEGLLHIPFDDYKVAESICSVALIFIIFYGGFGTNLKAAKPVAIIATDMNIATPNTIILRLKEFLVSLFFAIFIVILL